MKTIFLLTYVSKKQFRHIGKFFVSSASLTIELGNERGI